MTMFTKDPGLSNQIAQDDLERAENNLKHSHARWFKPFKNQDDLKESLFRPVTFGARTITDLMETVWAIGLCFAHMNSDADTFSDCAESAAYRAESCIYNFVNTFVKILVNITQLLATAARGGYQSDLEASTEGLRDFVSGACKSVGWN